jgi:hypothetical protein
MKNIAQHHSLFHTSVTGRAVAQAVSRPSVTLETWARSHVGCVVDEDELKQILLNIFRSSPVSLILPVLYSCLFVYYSCYMIIATNSIVEIKKPMVSLIDNQSSLTGDTQLVLLLVIHSGNGTNTLKKTIRTAKAKILSS